MIEIRKKSELKGAEKYGDCRSCAKRSSETELYQINFRYDDSTKNDVINLCYDCIKKLGAQINNL